jgi:hypothetical protein
MFNVSHCIFDEGDIGFGTQKTGCEVEAGTASQYVLESNLGPILDFGNQELISNPAVTADTGTYGTAPVATLRRKVINGFLNFTLDIAAPAGIGTASGLMRVAMPLASKWPVSFVGTDNATGEAVQANIGVGSTVMEIKFIGGASCVAAGTTIAGINGSYRL